MGSGSTPVGNGSCERPSFSSSSSRSESKGPGESPRTYHSYPRVFRASGDSSCASPDLTRGHRTVLRVVSRFLLWSTVCKDPLRRSSRRSPSLRFQRHPILGPTPVQSHFGLPLSGPGLIVVLGSTTGNSVYGLVGHYFVSMESLLGSGQFGVVLDPPGSSTSHLTS